MGARAPNRKLNREPDVTRGMAPSGQGTRNLESPAMDATRVQRNLRDHTDGE